MKKTMAGIFLILSTSLVSGCALAPMTKPDSGKTPNGYATELKNYERVNERNVHLTFERDLDEVDARFYWDEFQAGIVEKLNKDGITVSETGVPVVIRLDKFKLLGSSHASVRAHSTGLSVFNELGGGIVGAVAGVALESSERSRAKQNDDGRNFVPIIDFTIYKPNGNYTNTIKMTSIAQRGNYLASSRDVSVQAVSELFELK